MVKVIRIQVEFKERTFHAHKDRLITLYRLSADPKSRASLAAAIALFEEIIAIGKTSGYDKEEGE